MKIKARHLRILEVESYGVNERLLGVYVRFAKGPVAKTREILPEVFADYGSSGEILGLEFSRPGEYDIDAMQNVSEKVNVPALRAIDISRWPVQEHVAITGAAG